MSLWRMVASLTLDDTDFRAGLKRAESGIAGLASKLAAGFSVTALAVFTKQLVDMADTVGDLAEQIGITTDEVQALQRVASHSGVGIEAYASALIKLKKARADALSGDATARKNFAAFGLDASQDPFALLRAIADPQNSAQIAAQFDLIGMKVGKISGSLKDLRTLTVNELISKEAIQGLSKANDTTVDLWNNLKKFASNTLGTVVWGFTKDDDLWDDDNKRERASGTRVFQPGQRASKGSEDVESWMDKLGQDWIMSHPKVTQVTRQTFKPIQTDDLARIGGSFGPGSGLGSIEREQLEVARRMDRRLGVIESKVVSVPTEGAE